MTFDEYQKACHETAIYPKNKALEYLTLGLNSECGEVAGKVKKLHRDHGGELDDKRKYELICELGDVAWYISELAHFLGYSLEEVATLNIAKLRSRAIANSLRGEGDER